MSLDRFTDPDVARAADTLEQRLMTPIEKWGPPLEVLLPVAGTAGAVEHGLGEIPDGLLVLLVLGGNVRAHNYTRWTTTTAWLVADANNTRARVCFITTRKDVSNG